MKIGEKIKIQRNKLGLTLEQVGDYVGVSKSTVRKWETGYIANMKRDKISLLAKVLQMSPSEFISSDTTDTPVTPLLTPRENLLLTNYRKLNSDEQQKADDYVESLVKASENKKPNIIQKPIAAFGGAETLTVDSDVLKAAIDAALKEKGLI